MCDYYYNDYDYGQEIAARLGRASLYDTPPNYFGGRVSMGGDGGVVYDYRADPNPYLSYREDTCPQNNGGRMHFGHSHMLNKFELRSRDDIGCLICYDKLIGYAYGCGNCNFFLHEACFDTPLKIKHKSHTHTLTLTLYSTSRNSPYGDKPPPCDACGGQCSAFLYHCPSCKFNLHPPCAGLPLKAKYNRITFYLNEATSNKSTAGCVVCKKAVPKAGWVYYDKISGSVAHLDCASFGTDMAAEDIQRRLQRIREN